MSLARDKPKIVESRNLKNNNVNHFNDHLSHLLNNAPWNQNDPDQLWDKFRNIFNQYLIFMLHLKLEKLGAHILHGQQLRLDMR